MKTNSTETLFPTNFSTEFLRGRDKERACLEDVLERVKRTGRTELVMVAGRGGVGKSTLVRWFLKQQQNSPLAVGEGKCEQLNAEIPFAAVAQVVRILTLDALGDEQALLDRLAGRWLELLSGHGNSITELVPEAEHVLGDSGPALSLLTPQGQARIEQALIRTLEAFSEPGRLAVIFLDDLQWADEATLSFIKSLMLSPPANVLFIGAYREDEGAFAKWYFQVKHATRSVEANFTELALAPLTVAAFEHIIADTLKQPGKRLDGLVKVLYEKSGGNPYFAQQLLQSWIEDGVLTFVAGSWYWNDEQARLSAYADHVVDLIIKRIAKLPEALIPVLQNLACTGGRCKIALLAHVCDSHSVDFEAAIHQLTSNGLLVRRGEFCAFQHDRVLEAAYGLISPGARSLAHAHVARRMASYQPEDVASMAYEIGNQIEKVAPEDISGAERPGFVHILNLAARRAQRASLVDRAYEYNFTAKSLMSPGWWQSDFALAYEVALIECECLIAKGELTQGAERIKEILSHNLPSIKRAPLYRLEAALHTLQSNYAAAIDAALIGLGILGIELRREASAAQMREAYEAVICALNGRQISDLVRLPICDDAEIKDTMALLSTLVSSFFTSGGIQFTHLAKLVELTLRHGVTPDSPYGLAWFGVFIANLYEQYKESYEFGLVALAIVDLHGFESNRIATLLALDQVAVWTQPLEVALNYVQQASTRGRLSGDIGMECYACNHIISDMLAMGTALPLVEEAVDYGIHLTRSIGYRDIELLIQGQQGFVTVVTKGYPLNDRTKWVDACNERASAAVSLPTKFWVLLYAGMAEVFQQQWETAHAFLEQSLALASSTPAHINVADCHLFHALALSRSANGKRGMVSEVLKQECLRFEGWTRHNPRTFDSKLRLLQGESARYEGDYLKAMMYFEMSARAAEAGGFIHERALAHELAAIICREHALDIAASQHSRLAKAAYARWGAHHKANAVQIPFDPEKDSWLIDHVEAGDMNESSALQFGLKTAQALSQASVKDKLVETMFSDLLAHADAQYGVLINVDNGMPAIEASGRLTEKGVVTSTETVEPDQSIVPMKLLNMVLRTRESVIIHDASREVAHLRVQRQEAVTLRSALCLPLLRADELIGVLYLENNLSPGVFNASRVVRLELMASQIAIALGFARLYEQLINANEARMKAEGNLHAARAELVKNAHLTVLATLAASIAHEVNQPLNAIVISAEASTRWLNRGEPNIGKVREGLQRIKADGLRAADIIRALRGLAKKQATRLECVCISELVSGVVNTLSEELASKNVEMKLQLQPKLMIAGDRVQLEQVVLNLLNNAIDAMLSCPEATDHSLSVITCQEDNRPKAIIRDNGPGIPSEDMKRIFEPFYSTKKSGLGMGLAICASIAEAHGGTLTAFNVEPRGASFVLELPGAASGGPNKDDPAIS